MKIAEDLGQILVALHTLLVIIEIKGLRVIFFKYFNFCRVYIYMIVSGVTILLSQYQPRMGGQWRSKS